VTDEQGGGWPAAADGGVEIDTAVAHPARVYDYWLGGCFR
jgi:hypothetical protein